MWTVVPRQQREMGCVLCSKYARSTPPLLFPADDVWDLFPRPGAQRPEWFNVCAKGSQGV